MSKTTLKDGILYHKISKELYIRHKKEGWTDRRNKQRYGMHNKQMADWKNKNLTKSERNEFSLRKAASIKKLGKEDVKNMKIEKVERELQDKKTAVKTCEKMLKEQDDKSILSKKKNDEQESLIETLITEKELAYQKAQEWHERFNELQEDTFAIKENEIELDRKLIQEKHSHQITKQENHRLQLQIKEMRKINDPMRELLRVIL